MHKHLSWLNSIFNSNNFIFVVLLIQIVFSTFILALSRSSYNLFTYYNSLFVGLYGIVIILKSAKGKEYPKSSSQLLICGFLIICIIGIIVKKMISFVPVYSLLFQISLCCAIYAITAISSQAKIKKILTIIFKTFVICCFIVSIFSIIVYLFKINITLPDNEIVGYSFIGIRKSILNGNTRIRYSGFFKHPAYVGAHCASAIIIHYWLYKNNKSSFIFMIISAICNIAMIVLSNSRIGYLMIIIFIFLLMLNILKNKLGNRFNILKYFALFIICVVFGYLWITQFQYYDFTVWNRLSSNRILILSNILKHLKNSPLLGDGWLNTIASEEVNELYAHNLFGSLLAYTGILGTVIFVLSIISSLFSIRKNKKEIIKNNDISLYWLVIAIFACAQFDNFIVGDVKFVETTFFWLISGYLVYYQYGDNK